MSDLANTPTAPYYAVIFSSILKTKDKTYAEMATKMVKLANTQQGFLGIETAREDVGITVSYWKDLESIRRWKQNSEHLVAQEKGKNFWYKNYVTRICKVERDYKFKTKD